MDEYQDLLEAVANRNQSVYQRRRLLDRLVAEEADGTADALRLLLRDDDRYFRRDVVTALAKLTAPAAVDALMVACDDEDEYVRRDAVEALAERGDGRCIRKLEAMADDSYYGVREAVKTTLTRLRERGEVMPADASADTPAPVANRRQEPVRIPASQDIPGLKDEETTKPTPDAPRLERSTAPPPAPGLEGGALFHLDLSRAPDWQRMPRLKSFFGDRLDAARTLYERLRAVQLRLPQLAESIQGTLAELTWHRADLEDDLADCKRRMAETVTKRQEAEVHERTARVTLAAEQSRGAAWWFRALSSIHSRMAVDHGIRIAEFEEELKCAVADVDEARQAVAALETETQRLAEPIEKRREALKAQQDTHTGLADELMAADSAIDLLVLDIFLRTPELEIDSRLAPLLANAANPTFFRQGKEHLLRLLAELKQARRQLVIAEAEDDKGEGAVRDALDALGKEITDAFQLGEREVSVVTRLHGQVEFSRGPLSIGVAGTGVATGKAKATFMVTEVEWRAPAELEPRIVACSEAWRELGKRATNARAAIAGRDAARRKLLEWIRFVRLELERDFAESKP